MVELAIVASAAARELASPRLEAEAPSRLRTATRSTPE